MERTSAKCQKTKYARAKRAKILFFTVKYANLWGFCCRRRRGCLSSLIESWSKDDVNDNARKQWSDWLNEENNRAARAARTLVQFFDVVCQMSMWNFNIWAFNYNVKTQHQIFHSLYLILRCSYQSTCSVICQRYRMRAKSNNRKVVTNAQMFTFEYLPQP